MDPILVPIIGTAGGILLVLIPVAGITIRFAIKPVVESIARLKEIQANSSPVDVQQLDKRLMMLEQQMQTIEGSVRQLTETRDFDRQLSSPRP